MLGCRPCPKPSMHRKTGCIERADMQVHDVRRAQSRVRTCLGGREQGDLVAVDLEPQAVHVGHCRVIPDKGNLDRGIKAVVPWP